VTSSIPAPATPATPAVSGKVVTATATGGLAGVVLAAASLAAGFLGHGASLTDALGALGGTGLSATALFAFAFHHSKALAAEVPRIEALARRAEAEGQRLEPTFVTDLGGLRDWYVANKGALNAALDLVEKDFPDLHAAVGADEDALANLTRRVAFAEAKLPAGEQSSIEAVAGRVKAMIVGEAVTGTAAPVTPAQPAPATAEQPLPSSPVPPAPAPAPGPALIVPLAEAPTVPGVA